MTVPQSLFDATPEVATIIDDAERARPSPGPFRVHRMPIWYPTGMGRRRRRRTGPWKSPSWERDTLQPKHGINFGVEYTHTVGVAEIDDYDWYFAGFRREFATGRSARSLGIARGRPRWSTILAGPLTCGTPAISSSRLTPTAGAIRLAATPRSRSRACRSTPIQPLHRPASGDEESSDWIDTQRLQGHQEPERIPRAWVVHRARATVPSTGLSREDPQ